MKFNLLVLALLGKVDAASLRLKDSDVVADKPENATKNATVNGTALAAVNASANASAKSNDTTWTTTTTSSSTSWSSSSSSSSSWSSSSQEGSSWNSSWGMPAPPMIETETITQQESSEIGEEYGQIKLIGNADGRTAFIPTTVEPYIKASISTHRDLKNQNSQKRPQGNKRFNKQKFAFVQDNDWVGYEQKWKLQRHKTQPNNVWRLVDTTGHCLAANNPQDFKRNKLSSYVTSVFGKPSECTFWKKQQSGDGWSLVMARPGLNGSQKKHAFMSGWGLAILNNKPSDQEMGPTTSYLVIHKNPKKWSQWSSKILGAPIHVVQNITEHYTIKKQAVEVEEPDNSTNSTNATKPAEPAPPATPAGAAPPANATNATNKSNKSNKTRPVQKKKLPVPFAGTDNEEDNDVASQDLSYDTDDSDDCDDDDTSLRTKIIESLMLFQTNSGYLDVRWFRCLKLYEDKDDEDSNK